MSSGQWEVVGKNKKSQNGKTKNNEDKKSIKAGPKLEDLVPASQIKSYYSGMEIDDTKKTKEKKKDGEKKAKKQEKKESSKPKPPKTFAEALEMIDTTELANIVATNKVRFPNSHLVWLKEIANFLNSKIPIDIDDSTFSNFPPNYPVSVLPIDLKAILDNVLRDAGEKNSQLFFDITLTNLVNDMNRGQSVNGYRLLLQMLALDNPEFCVTSLTKSVNLRHSYLNRPPIGLSLLWALGQGGHNSFVVGMKVWQEVFLPIIELKNYSNYIITYLSNHLDRHARMDDTRISQEQFLAMFDTINSKRNGLSKELSSDLIKQLIKYKDIYFSKSGNKLQVTFNQLMKKLPNQYLSGASLDPYNQVIVESLVNCLAMDDSCNATWRQLFSRCSKQCATLIEFIDTKWPEVSRRLKHKSLKITITQYKEVCGETLKGKKKDETVVKINKICQDILDRMASTKRFPWMWMILLLLVGVTGLISYDVSRVNGNFPKSVTGQLLNDLGLLEHSQKAWQKSLSSSARGYIWLETNVPVYYTQAVEFSKPYSQLSKDLFALGVKKTGIFYGNIKDYVIEKTPVVVATIDQYIPGAVETIQTYFVSGVETIKKYSNEYYQVVVQYLTTKVFVGEWAPEILQVKTQLALNATRSHVNDYFHWFRQQVHTYSKIP